MNGRIAGMLGVEFPILGFSHCRDVVAAVSAAGGFGVLGATALSAEELAVELDWIEAHAPGRPYGVDLVFPKVASETQGRLSTWEELAPEMPDEQKDFVEDMLGRYDVPPLPDDHDDAFFGHGMRLGATEELLEVALDRNNVRLIASALGSPPVGVVSAVHDRGVAVAALSGTPAQAERNVAAGVDMIVCQGHEAGGHVGEIGSMVLIPNVVDAVAPVPVVAAGGIANGRQMAAAFVLGAEGVWCGSAWLTSRESEALPGVKAKFRAASCTDTVRTTCMSGKPQRVLRSAWTDEWGGAEAPATLPMPYQRALLGYAQRRYERVAGREDSGAYRLLTYAVGQVVGQLTREQSCRDIVREMVEEYVDAMDSFTAGRG